MRRCGYYAIIGEDVVVENDKGHKVVVRDFFVGPSSHS